MKTDIILYKYFKKFLNELFKLLDIKIETPDDYEFTSVVVKETEYRMDGLINSKNKEGDIYFAEFQFQRKNLYSRFFAEIFLYIDKYQIKDDWKAVAVFPGRSEDMGLDKPFEVFRDSKKLMVIYLEDIPKETLNKYPLNILSLLIAKDEEVKDRVTQIIKSIKTEVNDESEQMEISDLIINIIMNRLKNITIEEVRKMLSELLDIKDSKAAKELIEEGKMEGKIEGKIEGKMEGKIESAYAMLKDGIPIEKVMKYTGLGKEEIFKPA